MKIKSVRCYHVILQEISDGVIEVAAIYTMASLMSAKNEKLTGLAREAHQKLAQVIE